MDTAEHGRQQTVPAHREEDPRLTEKLNQHRAELRVRHDPDEDDRDRDVEHRAERERHQDPERQVPLGFFASCAAVDTASNRM